MKSVIRLDKNRKAQMEIMGLAVIMILAVLGLLFVVKFVLMKPETKSELRQSQQESQLAANLINAFLKTTTDCPGKHSVTTLIQDCAQLSPRIRCGALSSCEFVNQTINDILDQTLEEWGKTYQFTISDISEEINISNGDCSGERETKFSPIQAAGKTVVLKLDICS